MQKAKHTDALKEVMATIEEALGSSSVLPYQRRLIAMISIGLQHMVELYLHRLKVIKPGIHIKHNWFALGEENIRSRFSAVLTMPFGKVPEINEIVSLARSIEIDRNDILYGAPLADGKSLKEKINSFLEIKKIVEKTGVIS